MSEALEYVHRVRGAVVEMHQLMGRADLLFGDAAKMLDDAGHPELAKTLKAEVVGRNALPDRWTFQIVEEFDDTYYSPVNEVERRIRDELMNGQRHVHESELKQRRQ